MSPMIETSTVCIKDLIALEGVPSDILPTGKFFSMLPGMDNEYSKFVDFQGETASIFNGKVTIRSEVGLLKVVHSNQDTTILIKMPRQAELWEIEEQYCGNFIFKLRRCRMQAQFVPMSETDNVISVDFDGRYSALVYCCPEGRSDYEVCGNLCDKLFNPFNKTQYGIDRPSKLPIRRVAHINMGRSKVEGFKNTQEVTNVLIGLRELILKSQPVIDAGGGVIPSSSSLADGLWIED